MPRRSLFLLLLLPALLAGCFSPGDVAAQCEAAAREQLAALNPPAELRDFQQLQSGAHTERTSGKTVHLGLSTGTLSAEQAGEIGRWQYACRVHGAEVTLQLAPAAEAPARPPGSAPSDTTAPPTFDLGGEGETDL